MSPEPAIEVSRWMREAERAVERRIAREQLGEAFEPVAPAWGRIAMVELGRLAAVSLFAATLLLAAVILAVTG
jgi:hypothetical protein